MHLAKAAGTGADEMPSGKCKAEIQINSNGTMSLMTPKLVDLKGKYTMSTHGALSEALNALLEQMHQHVVQGKDLEGALEAASAFAMELSVRGQPGWGDARARDEPGCTHAREQRARGRSAARAPASARPPPAAACAASSFFSFAISLHCSWQWM